MVDTEHDGDNSFVNENRCKIFCKYWSTNITEPKALIYVAHGAAEHCLFYGELAERLTQDGYYVFANDHQGHGQSEGSRMHITDFRHYIRDVICHCEKVKAKFPGVPLYILGHSMGGAVSIMSVLDHPDLFTGMVLIAPVVTPENDTVGPIKIFLGKLVAKVFPHFPVLSLNSDDISRDPAVVQKTKDDPLTYQGWMKAKWASCLLEALIEIESKVKDIKIPFLVLHGDTDNIINSVGSQTLYDKAASKDKTIKIFPGGYHQLHGDIEPTKSETLKDISKWLKDHIIN